MAKSPLRVVQCVVKCACSIYLSGESVMKSLLAFAMVVMSALPALAGHKVKFNCETGSDPYGGKQCVYRVPMCERQTCEAAAKCMVKQTDNEIEWRMTTSQKVLSSKPIVTLIREQDRPGKAVRVLEAFPVRKKSVTDVRTVLTYVGDNGQCMPFAIQ
jgi:hypothetical protein